MFRRKRKLHRFTEQFNVEPNVAAEDQSRARALDALRTADSYLLMVPGENEQGKGIAVLANSSVEFLAGCNLTLQHAIVEAAERVLRDDPQWPDTIFLDGEEMPRE